MLHEIVLLTTLTLTFKRPWRDVTMVVAASAEPASSFDKMAARLAFRRRSISENTYDRFFPLHQNVDSEASTSGTLAADTYKRAVGVVCSNEDLKAIVHQHKRRHSPTEIAVAAPSFVTSSSAADDMDDRSPTFLAAASNDRVGGSVVESGLDSSAGRRQVSPMSSVEALSCSQSSATGTGTILSAGIYST